MNQLQTSTVSNQNISAALLVATYTATACRGLTISVALDQIAGNGNYQAYITRQLAGAGSAYQTAVTSEAVASGVTNHIFNSIEIPVDNTDVVKVYVLGLAGDTTTPDIITNVYESDYVRPTVAGRSLDIATTGEVGLDFDNIHDASGAHTLTNVTVPVATSVTNDVGITQAAADKAWGTAARALTDKAGFSLSAAGILAIWNQLTADAGIVTASFAKKLADWALGADHKALLSTDAQTGVTIPTVTTLTNAPANSSGVTSILADYARRTGDYATVAALSTLQGNVTTILTDYARRTGDYATVTALATLQGNVTSILADYARRTGDYSTLAVGAKMDLQDAPNATAIAAIQNGLSKPGTAQTITPPTDMALNSTVAKDATVSKPGTAQTISSNADMTAIKGKTDQLVFTIANQVDANALSGGGGTPPTAAAIADAVLDETAVGHTGLIPSFLDAKVSLIPTNPYTGTPPTVGQIADAVLDEAAAGHTGMLTLIYKILKNKTITDPVTHAITVYDDNDITPLFTALIYQDVAGTTPYVDAGIDRRDRLA